MNTESNDITIKINGQTHQFNTDDTEVIRKLPWQERKQLIELLEKIKQAEYIKPAKNDGVEQGVKNATHNSLNKAPVDSSALKVNKTHQLETNLRAVDVTSEKKLDPAIKPSEADVDGIMKRLILEQKKQHPTVPDKSIVVKWLLIIAVVITVLAWII